MDATIETLEATPVMGITEHVRMAEIGLRIGEMMPEIMAVAGPSMAGPVLARYSCFDAETGESDMQLAVPVSAPMEAQGRVAPSELPAGRAVTTWHVGPYDSLVETWGALTAWMAAEGHVSRGDPWEEYHSDCAVTPPAELRTRIVWPIE
jgi:effector-binding domain-containing protein